MLLAIYRTNIFSKRRQPKHNPKAKVAMLKKPAFIAAAIAIALLMCAFTVYVFVGGDMWLQKPSNDPIETVRSAIENQIDKDYAIRIEIGSIEIDEAETKRVLKRFISGELAERRGWSDDYLAEHFVVVKAVYYAEYDHTKTTRSDGNVLMYFYLTQDIDSGKWTIVDNSGNVNLSNDLTEEKETAASDAPDAANAPGALSAAGAAGAIPTIEEQIFSYLSGLFTEAYSPYYDGLRYEISNYEETISDNKCVATFLWTMIPPRQRLGCGER